MEINANDYKNVSRTINAEKVTTRSELKVPLIISDVTEETLNDKKKIALKFVGIQDVLILNQTNLDVMIAAKGTNANKWITSTITLTVVPSKYNGQTVNSVFISKVV